MTTPQEPQKNRRIPPWRWAWMGFAAAAILWVGSSIYFQRAQQFAEVDYMAEDIEEADFERLSQSNIRNAMFCKAAAGILCLGSLLYILSHVDIRSRRPRRD